MKICAPAILKIVRIANQWMTVFNREERLSSSAFLRRTALMQSKKTAFYKKIVFAGNNNLQTGTGSMGKRQEKNQPESKPKETFFREIQIEFLLHELKDPVSIINAGTRM